ncbi:MAG: hypothetical protein WCW01_03745, partial [Gammaproteobacteria bacterium]
FLYVVLLFSSSVLADIVSPADNTTVAQSLTAINNMPSVAVNDAVNQNHQDNPQIAPNVVLVPSSNAERYVADCFKNSEYKDLTHYPSVSLFQ